MPLTLTLTEALLEVADPGRPDVVETNLATGEQLPHYSAAPLWAELQAGRWRCEVRIAHLLAERTSVNVDWRYVRVASWQAGELEVVASVVDPVTTYYSDGSIAHSFAPREVIMRLYDARFRPVPETVPPRRRRAVTVLLGEVVAWLETFDRVPSQRKAKSLAQAHFGERWPGRPVIRAAVREVSQRRRDRRPS